MIEFDVGHLHNEDFIRAVPSPAQFEQGQAVIALVGPEAFGSGVQHHKVIDAGAGLSAAAPEGRRSCGGAASAPHRSDLKPGLSGRSPRNC